MPALALTLGLCTGLACEDAPHCDVDLDAGELDERLCESVELIVGCLEDTYGGLDRISDEQLESAVDGCFEEFDFCAIDPLSLSLVLSWTVDEIRGDQNECIG